MILIVRVKGYASESEVPSKDKDWQPFYNGNGKYIPRYMKYSEYKKISGIKYIAHKCDIDWMPVHDNQGNDYIQFEIN